MASATLVNEFRRLNADLVSLAQKDLAAFWRTLDKSNVEVARKALTEFSTALVDTYGRPASLLAAQFYDDLRAGSPNAKGTFRAILADPPPAEQIAATARWAVGPLDGDMPDEVAALERMSGAVQRFVSGAGRDTIARSSYRDPSAGGWARVPRGVNTCGFCRELASRGPAYRSADTAGNGTHYHDNCHCVPTQVWDGDDLPEGYDPDALYDEYLDARESLPEGERTGASIASVLDAGRPR